MAVTLSAAGTGIWNRLGKIFGVMERAEDFIIGTNNIVDASTKSFQEAINEFVPFVGSSGSSTVNTDLEFVVNLTTGLDAFRNQLLGLIYGRLFAVAQQVLIEMVNDDTKLPVKTTTEAIKVLRDQMGSSDDLEASAIGTTAQASIVKSRANTGTVIIGLLSDNSRNPNTGNKPTIRAESITFRCMADASDKKVPKGGELFMIEGEQAFPATDHRWPGGSGRFGPVPSTSDNVADGRTGTRNILRNSSYNSFSSNKPDSWEIVSGSAGSTILEETSTVARGSSALKMASDGSTNIHIRQKINGRGATNSNHGRIASDQYVAISFLARLSAAASAGVLKVGLTNADGFILSNHVEVAHGDISTSAWTQVTTSFRVADGWDFENVFFSLQQTTAFTNGKNLFIDGLVFAGMYQTHRGGYHCLIVPGPVDFRKGDTIDTANTNDGAGTMERMMDRFYNLYDMGEFIPSVTDDSETISDSLIA